MQGAYFTHGRMHILLMAGCTLLFMTGSLFPHGRVFILIIVGCLWFYVHFTHCRFCLLWSVLLVMISCLINSLFIVWHFCRYLWTLKNIHLRYNQFTPMPSLRHYILKTTIFIRAKFVQMDYEGYFDCYLCCTLLIVYCRLFICALCIFLCCLL